MDIELWQGSTKAIIDPRGAWVTNVSDDNGDILFPKRSLKASNGDIKQRGGSHVCLPQFGPGGKSGLPQHGFARDMMWKVIKKDNSTATLQLANGQDEYRAMQATLVYALSEAVFTSTVTVKNTGEQDMRISPAFHPYFALGHDETAVFINDKKYQTKNLSEAEFFTANSVTLKTAQRVITIQSDTLQTWARWTDSLAPYVCVEPTLAGFSFENDTASPQEILTPGGEKTYEMTISWA